MAKKIILIGVFILLAFFAIIRMNEDTWICDDGEWVKHGNPSSLAPEGKCGELYRSIKKQ